MSSRDSNLGGTTLFVASTGGHLEELIRLAARLSPRVEQSRWVTFDDPQSRSLLAGDNVTFARYVAPRDYRSAAANLGTAHRLLRSGRYARVVSTGSGIALPFFLAARLEGISSHYIESAARASGPSLTGRLLGRLPGVQVYAQYPAWAGARWRYRGSLFDDYEPAPLVGAPHLARRVVVTLGTMRAYGFRRAVERLHEILPEVTAPGAEVLWQVGNTPTADLDIGSHDRISAAVLRSAMSEADLVVAHAGVGSVLTAMDLGKCPVLLPRRRQHGEHVDDHQQMIATDLGSRGLAVSTEVAELGPHHLRAAMARTVRAGAAAQPFVLD